MAWEQFNQPEVTGITYPRLVASGCLVRIFLRLPAILLTYKLRPNVSQSWKEALSMGYYGGLYHSVILARCGSLDRRPSIANLILGFQAWARFFILSTLCTYSQNLVKVKPIVDEAGPTEIRRLSLTHSTPKNSTVHPKRRDSITVYNRFSRAPHGTRLAGITPTLEIIPMTMRWCTQEIKSRRFSLSTTPVESRNFFWGPSLFSFGRSCLVASAWVQLAKTQVRRSRGSNGI